MFERALSHTCTHTHACTHTTDSLLYLFFIFSIAFFKHFLIHVHESLERIVDEPMDGSVERGREGGEKSEGT